MDKFRRKLVLPARVKRDRRAAQASGKALEAVGFLLVAFFALAACWVFFRGLEKGEVRLKRAGLLSISIFGGMVLTWTLEGDAILAKAQSLWAPWVSTLTYLTERITKDLWMTIVLLAVIGAADALDRGQDNPRGASLWKLLKGNVADPDVALASGRGFAVGLLCGGVLTLVLTLLGSFGSTMQFQPRGVFMIVMNSTAPPLTALLFFLNVALIEELGYRWFGTTWLLDMTGKKWLAILIPAVVFGLSHTRMVFLPPLDPFWGRALMMTAVGLVWGWALLRYDALTVVLSHWVADLVVFSSPRLMSSHPDVVAATVATFAVPLLPAILGIFLWLRRRGSTSS